MRSPSRIRTISSEWRFALIGAFITLPVTVIVNWFPNSEANLAGGIGIIGAFIAGFIAATRSVEPDAAGFRAGLLGGIVGVLTPIVAGVSIVIENTAVAWPSPSRTVFFVGAGAVLLCIAPVFGLVCGRVGGWTATTVAKRGTADTS